jgi:superfamily II DNA/RNA helicase
MQNFLSNKTLNLLSVFLKQHLPLISATDDWWKNNVLNYLSHQQLQLVERHKITTLEGLDLAGLLRVFDQNWCDLKNHLNLPPENRNLIKEMQTIRNRWAHQSSEGVSTDDLYRDLDTLQRFLLIIEAGQETIQLIEEEKNILMQKKYAPAETISQPPIIADESNDKTIVQEAKFEFSKGQTVTQKSNPEKKGVITDTILGNPENSFTVFIDNKPKTFFASQLVSAETPKVAPKKLSCQELHTYLSATQLQSPSLSTLYSLNSARIDFIPHQFKPVLRFIRADRPRLLIADSVGVGKTIEAGLILRELQARREIKSVLIICPRALVAEEKWKNEMKRFGEEFTHLDGAGLRYCIKEMHLDGHWPERHQKIIIPYSLLDEKMLHGEKGKRIDKKGLLDLDPPPKFDLVIVDEAHHIRNTQTHRHNAVRFFCDNAEAVIFLTATPIQLGEDDLFTLLNTLRSDLVIDKESFNQMAKPNQYIHQAVNEIRTNSESWATKAIENLNKACQTDWGQKMLDGNPAVEEVMQRLQSSPELTPKERIKIISDTEELQTFSGLINRTRRIDIGDFTIRKPETIETHLTPEQEIFHNKLINFQAKIYDKLHGNQTVKFMLTTIQRQAASSLLGLIPLLDSILNRNEQALKEFETLFTSLEIEFGDANGNTIPANSFQALEPFKADIESLIQQAQNLDHREDKKFDRLVKVITDKQEMPNNKIILFSSFRHTLNYLNKRLNNKYPNLRIGLIHGGIGDEDRREQSQRFAKPKEDNEALDIILFSEVGCEGLDYQFCDCIINYDLPWNPMRIEQRIGRIDRNGQKSETIAIINFITKDTIEHEIYHRCLMRIGIFERSIGGNEEILGEINKAITQIAESYNLSAEEKEKKLQQLSDNQIRKVQEQEKLENEQGALFGIHVPKDQIAKEVEDARSFWLSPASIEQLTHAYLHHCFDDSEKTKEYLLGEKTLKTLRLSETERTRLKEDFQNLELKKDPIYRHWERWLEGNEPHLSITFDADCAKQNPETTLLNLSHPLIKQAAKAISLQQKNNNLITYVSVISNDFPAGDYPFAIYLWHFQGVKEDYLLKPIAPSQELTKKLTELLTQATDLQENPNKELTILEDNSPIHQELETQHHQQWEIAKQEHSEKIQKTVTHRTASIKTSHQARMALLKDQLNRAKEEKIKRMYQAQYDNAEKDYQQQNKKLEQATNQADLTFDKIAMGIIRIIEE